MKLDKLEVGDIILVEGSIYSFNPFIAEITDIKDNCLYFIVVDTEEENYHHVGTNYGYIWAERLKENKRITKLVDTNEYEVY